MITLPKTDLQVYPLCLGGNVFGYSSNSNDSIEILDAYHEGGGNFIDTADMYSQWGKGNKGGESETVIGDWIKKRKNRNNVVIASKVGKLLTRPGLKAANIAAACEDSLRRLQTDCIDLYYAHLDDLDTPIEETLVAFDSLIKAGKVRYIAASNFTSERLQESLELSQKLNLSSYIACQDGYNLMDRDYEKSLMPTLKVYGLSQIPYYGLARGFLTGKYRPGIVVKSVRASVVQSSYANQRGWKILEKLDEIAKEKGSSVSAIALAWLRAQPTVTTPIASATSLEQLKEIMQVVTLHDHEIHTLSALI
jgi:aryl-alcohol dehydrogenase-like predicted oxidoreductase